MVNTDILYRKLRSVIVRLKYFLMSKESSELDFWVKEKQNLIYWAKGKLEHYGCSIDSQSLLHETDPEILTKSLSLWLRFFQTQKYIHDLELDDELSTGGVVLDIGSGPFPSASIFNDATVISLDPLFNDYRKLGYVFDLKNNIPLQCASENISLPTDSVDFILSVNALDHVNDFAKTCDEIKRVLKPYGRLCLHLHYHPKTKSEPIELNDFIVMKFLGNDLGLRKIYEKKEKFGYTLPNESNESFALWKNY